MNHCVFLLTEGFSLKWSCFTWTFLRETSVYTSRSINSAKFVKKLHSMNQSECSASSESSRATANCCFYIASRYASWLIPADTALISLMKWSRSAGSDFRYRVALLATTFFASSTNSDFWSQVTKSRPGIGKWKRAWNTPFAYSGPNSHASGH